MSQWADFIKDFTLIILVAFAITVLYPHIQAVFNPNIYKWKFNVRGIGRDAVKQVKQYPFPTIIPILVIVIGGFFLWLSNGGYNASRIEDDLARLEEKIEANTKAINNMNNTLEQILLEIQSNER